MSKSSSLSSMSTVTKKEIIKTIAVKKGLTLEVTKVILDRLFSEIIEALAEGDRIEFRHFGVFSPGIMKGRSDGRNPRTGESIGPIPDKKTVRFKPTGVLKNLEEFTDGRYTD